MTAERDASYAISLIKDYIATIRQPYRYVRAKVASYATEKDFHAFKPGQRWDIYNDAISLFGRMCEERAWNFENSDVITVVSFDELAKQNGWIGDVSQRIDFVLTLLGHEVHGPLILLLTAFLGSLFC